MHANRLLAAYSAVLTGAAAVALLTGAAQPPGKARFTEIDVERINVREPDGTLRMSLSGRGRLGGVVVRGTEYDFPRDQAGILFFNDEGSETGGLLFGGRDADGKPVSSGSLTFDRYEQDQVVQILEREDGPSRFAGLLVSDRPDGRPDFAAIRAAGELPTRAERAAAFKAANAGEAHRVVVGRETDDSAQVSLRDAQGRVRLVMRVEADGKAVIQFLDETGAVLRSVEP